MATWTFGNDGLWRDENGNVADEFKAEELATKAMSGGGRSLSENIKGGAGRGLVGLPAMLASAATAAPQQNPDLMQFAEVVGGEPIPENASGGEAVMRLANKAGIPTEYDPGSFAGLLTDFTVGSLAFGGPGRLKTAKNLIAAGSRPAKAYLGQFGREVGQAAAAAGSTALVESASQDVNNPIAKAALGLGAPMFPNLALLGLTGGVRAFGRGMDPDALSGRANKFKATTGADPMAYQVADNDRMFLAARGLEMTGAGALPMARQMENQADQFKAQTAKIAGGANTSTSIGGSVAETGLFGPNGYVERGKVDAEQLYSDYFAKFPAGSRFQLSETKKFLDEYIDRFKNDPEWAEGSLDPSFIELRKVIDATERRAAGPAIETIRAKRDEIGRIVGRPTIGPADKPVGDYKALYAALSKDLEAAAVAQGPDALAAFKAADSHWKEYRRAIDDYIRPLEGVDVEKIYDRIVRGSPDEINATFGMLGKKQQEVFTEIAINRLGLNTNKKNPNFETYSPNTFLTNWSKLSPRARTALIPNSTQRVQLDDMAKQFDLMTRNNKVVFNSSGTTGSGQLSSQIIGLLSGVVGGGLAGGAGLAMGADALTATGMAGFGMAASISGVMGVSHWASKKMADPKFVSWLAKSNTISPVAIPGHIARLSSIDFGNQADNEMRDQAVSLLMQRFNQSQ